MWANLVVLTVLAFAQPDGFDIPSEAAAIYQLDGYIDEAPAGQTVQYRMSIGSGSKNRMFLITKSQILTDGDPGALFRNLGVQKPDFILVGPDEARGRILDAKVGAHVSGSFYYRRGSNDLEFDPKALKVE